MMGTPILIFHRFCLLLLASISCSFCCVAQKGNERQLTLYFSSGKYKVSASEQLRLHTFMQGFDTVQVTKVFITGYCDDIGNKAYNDSLSLKRAQEVVGLFLPLNVDASKFLVIEGKGAIPRDSLPGKNIDDSRALHRKVEIKVSYLHLEKEEAIVSSQSLGDHHKVGDKIVLENILFVGGYRTFLPESYSALDTLTAVLKRKPSFHILILGHICCMPPGKDGPDLETGIYNLSFMRAKAVYDYLVEKGISAERLSYKGMKGDYPTGKGNRFDRRVEIVVTQTD
jgi:outer membrane protein OmpA-like peptidoglycan-associated protein